MDALFIGPPDEEEEALWKTHQEEEEALDEAGVGK